MEITLLLLYCNPSPSPMKSHILLFVCHQTDQYGLLENAGTNSWFLEPICSRSENEDLIIDQAVIDKYHLQSARLLSVLQYYN